MLDDLYREVILDHYRSPRNHGLLAAPAASARGNNPVCGDDVTVQLDVDGDILRAIRFSGNGCSISQASASMMTEGVVGRSLSDALALVVSMENMMRGKGSPEVDGLDDIAALEGVKKFPARVKCALLGWETLKEAILAYRLDHAGVR